MYKLYNALETLFVLLTKCGNISSTISGVITRYRTGSISASTKPGKLETLTSPMFDHGKKATEGCLAGCDGAKDPQVNLLQTIPLIVGWLVLFLWMVYDNRRLVDVWQR